MKRIAILLLTLSALAFGQDATPDPAAAAALAKPTLLLVGPSYDQFSGFKANLTLIGNELDKPGIYYSGTAELVGNKWTNAEGKTGFLVGYSLRFGQHKGWWDGKNFWSIGGDLGPSISQAAQAATSSGITLGGSTISFSGSFTASYGRMLTSHWGFAIPVRMLWISGAGPLGKGAWNPVGQVDFAYRFGK